MSREAECTSTETDLETNGKNSSDDDLSKNEEKEIASQSETGMLEDEEMPTYISVSTPTNRDQSNVENAKKGDSDLTAEENHSRSPCPSDDQGGGSVYVVSSGDEESDRPPYNDEDDYDYNSEDIEDMERNECERAMLDEEEEDDDDEEEDHPLRMHNDDDEEEELDEEYEGEQFERASDDFILNKRLKSHHKERSLSLQDLSICKNDVCPLFETKNHRLNITKQNYVDYPQGFMLYPTSHRRPSIPLKYKHVQSKVKTYINDIKKQNRRSMERRLRDQEYMKEKSSDNIKDFDTGCKKAMITTQIIKNYAKRLMKDFDVSESYEEKKNPFNSIQILENGQNVRTVTLTEDKRETDRRSGQSNAHYEAFQKEKNSSNLNDKSEKHNGTLEPNLSKQDLYLPSLEQNLKYSGNKNEPMINGHQQTPTLFNLRTLSYEEYMHGNSTPYQTESDGKEHHNMQQENNDVEAYNDAEIISVAEVDNSNATCPLKIENVKSIRITSEESKDDVENVKFAKVNRTNDKTSAEIEATLLKSQLDQKNILFNNLKDSYQNTLAENFKMKQELSRLKKTLAKYENENQARVTKVAAVQTDIIIQSTKSNQSTTNNIKQLGSSITSTSSTEQWAESIGSSDISVKPPNLTTLLHSDDSIVMTDNTPKKTGQSLSCAFITSSRILQTLSKITHGKSKSDNVSIYNSNKVTNEDKQSHGVLQNKKGMIASSSVVASNSPMNSKKRKASDTLGASIFLQPPKMPHTAIELQKKSNSIVDTNKKINRLDNNTDAMLNSQKDTTIHTDDIGGTSAAAENKSDKVQDNDDRVENVKCFVYQEDEKTNDRSFLIQAEELSDDKILNNKNCVRECGPYLLGNVEVRMSEVNGTINIWGKEISQESVLEMEEEEAEEEDEEIQIPVDVYNQNMCHCWQKTPHARFHNNKMVCSTNKKSKMPSMFGGSHSYQCSHSNSFNTIKSPMLVDESNDRRYVSNSLNANASIRECSNSPCQYKEWLKHKQSSNSQEKLYSCCMHHADLSEKGCNCACNYEKQKFNDSSSRIKERLNDETERQFSPRNTSDLSKHLHENITKPSRNCSEAICKHTLSPRSVDMNFQHDPKCPDAFKNTSHVCNLSPRNVCNQETNIEHLHDRNSLNSERDPLISLKGLKESPNIRQRRSSGKKVRGILMDFIKSCGDCRASNSANTSKGCLYTKETPYSVKCSPSTNVTSCSPASETCSNLQQPIGRCCHAYAQHIESQLEEFRIEIERVRSRSDAILNMLNILHSVETN